MIRIAIVGCGFSGLSFLVHFIKRNTVQSQISIDIYDKSHNIPRGLAYSTLNLDHLLNVPVYKMSIFEDDPYHLINWLKSHKYNYLPNDFIPRKIYGDYLEDILQSTLTAIKDKNINITIHKTNVEAITKDLYINNTQYQYIILTIGSEPRYIPHTISAFAYNEITQIRSDNVIIIGTGLTMVDTAITLSCNPNIKKITAISTHNILPKEHRLNTSFITTEPVITPDDAKQLSLVKLVHKFRSKISDLPDWRPGFDSIRPISQEIWQNVSINNRRQFLARLMPYYAKFRHRMPPHQAEIINNLIANKVLELEHGSFDITKYPQTTPIINCSGIELDVIKSHNILLQNLLKLNIITPHITQCGINQPDDERIFVISSLLTGELGEIFAVPELRKLAKQTAIQLHNIIFQSRNQV